MVCQRIGGIDNGKFEVKEDGTYRLQVRDLFGEPRERDVLARMVEPVRVFAQVGDDVLHQLVVGRLAPVEDIQFLLQQGEQLPVAAKK